MDPVSIVGIIGSVLSVADVVGRSIKKLSDIKTRYRNAPLQASTLIGQLYIVKAALDELSSWSLADLEHNPRFRQLSLQINASLDCFEPLMLALQGYLAAFEVQVINDMTPAQRISMVWNEKELSTYLELLDRQVNALNLFLQILQCKTWTEQQRMVQAEESQTVLKLAEECSSLVSSDGISIFSENTNAVSIEFDFDALILGSRVYQSAHRSHLRQVIRGGQQNETQVVKKINADDTNDTGLISTDDTNITEQTSADGTNVTERTSADGTTITEQTGADKSFSSENNGLGMSVGQQRVEDDQVRPVSSPSTQSVRAIASRPSKKLTDQQTIVPRGGISISSRNSTLSASTLSAMRDIFRGRGRKPSSAEQAALRRSAEIDDQILRDLAASSKEAKVLLLGPSVCGKSTMLKSIQVCLGPGFSVDERKNYRGPIWATILSDTITASYCGIFDEDDDDGDKISTKTKLFQDVQFVRDQIHGAYYDLPMLDPKISDALTAIWTNEDFQVRYNRRGDHPFDFNQVEYMMKNLSRISSSSYVPSNEDILRSRLRTTGITETRFRQDDHTLKIYDVGGARSERKKWVHCFADVSTIILLIDSVSYCQRVVQDSSANAMAEQELLFQSLVNSKWFPHTSFLTLFTKVDLIEECLKTWPVDDYFKDFQNPKYIDPTINVEVYLDQLENHFRKFVPDERVDHVKFGRCNLMTAHADGTMRNIIDQMVEWDKLYVARKKRKP